MNNKIVCFSAADKQAKTNFKKTVTNFINFQELNNKFNLIEPHPNITHVSIWGARWDKLWKKLNKNDVVLFYANHKFISYGTLIFRIESSEVAKYLWGSNEYKYLVIMSPHALIECPRDKFWKEFNYATKFYIQGLRIPDIKVQREILSKYGDIQSFLEDVLEIEKINLPYYN